MRVINWQQEFAREMEAAQSKRFRWGSWDCCQWPARMVQAITGRDTRDLFPKYRTRREAEVILKDCGGMLDLVSRALGPSMHPSFATVADIVLADFGLGLQPGVCGGVWSFSPGRRGLERRKTDSAVAAWKI
jgi:hypothetical protein